MARVQIGVFFLEHSGLDLYCLPGYRPGPDCSLERSGLGLYAVRVSYADMCSSSACPAVLDFCCNLHKNEHFNWFTVQGGILDAIYC